ncbi:PREDICTED: elongin-A-like [Fragaria vesca subsp. vesca]|uniref:elongin-A-like n=1 Tax=Fragaria vesca subsp. vesca TaxID=101020 RepID=UPI0002C2F6A0|nr:PREDICTED: elongin-A-like [Fragaria vesca subsp. vesca]
METTKAPSLVELCIETAIDNRKYLGDVGDVDFKFLEQILSHCSKEQLMHIEKRTKGRDLSPVTDKFWKRIFRQEFGSKATDELIQNIEEAKKMKQKKISYTWLKLYQAKLKKLEEEENEVGERVKRLYEKDGARKQSRQVRVCNKVEPSRKRKSNFGGQNQPMSKVRKRFQNCLEVRNARAMKTKKATNY